MSQLAEQIAVLDGMDTSSLDVDDGRIGKTPASPALYAKQIAPGVQMRKNVIDASAGANYSGGSAYAPGLPLMPSSIGLAGFGNIPSVLPARRHVVDPSGGANYTGGSDYAPGMPLLVSSSGLAASLIAGGYGSAGLGRAMIDGGYGSAGLGAFGSAAPGNATDADLMSAFNGLEDGRIGRIPAQTNQYAKPLMPGVQTRKNVIDASVGANYSGGSSYAPGLPLMPSSIGLAGIDGLFAGLEGLDALDAVDDLAFVRKLGGAKGRAFLKKAGKGIVGRLRRGLRKVRSKARQARTPSAKRSFLRSAFPMAARLKKIRAARRAVLASNLVNGVPVQAYKPVSPTSMWK